MRTIYISKDDLHVSAWLWTLPLTEEKKNGFPFVTDGEELKNMLIFSVAGNSVAVLFFSFKGMPLRGS